MKAAVGMEAACIDKCSSFVDKTDTTNVENGNETVDEDMLASNTREHDNVRKQSTANTTLECCNSQLEERKKDVSMVADQAGSLHERKWSIWLRDGMNSGQMLHVRGNMRERDKKEKSVTVCRQGNGVGNVSL
jgi:hypothetical protein